MERKQNFSNCSVTSPVGGRDSQVVGPTSLQGLPCFCYLQGHGREIGSNVRAIIPAVLFYLWLQGFSTPISKKMQQSTLRYSPNSCDTFPALGSFQQQSVREQQNNFFSHLCLHTVYFFFPEKLCVDEWNVLSHKIFRPNPWVNTDWIPGA